MALAAPVAMAGGSIQYVKANTTSLQANETYDQFVVKYRADSVQRADRAQMLQSVNSAASRALPSTGKSNLAVRADFQRRLAIGADVIKTSRKLDEVAAAALIRQIAADPNVEYVEPVVRMVRLETPTDPRWNEQWGLKVPAQSGGGINLPPALDLSKGSGVVVAVLDTGVTEHPDLSENVLFDAGYDFHERKPGGYDPGDFTTGSEGCGVANSSWHGTHVAGTIAAINNNGIGVASVAPESTILPVRVLGKCGGGSTDIADAIVWSSGGTVAGVPANTHKADVINMSLGGRNPAACPNVYKDALAFANNANVTVVVAAGNSDGDVTGANGVGYTLGNCGPSLIVVGGVGPLGRRGGVSSTGATEAGFGSSHGTRVDIAGPMGSGWTSNQEQVLSTVNTGTSVPVGPGYAFYYGTSMASPHVAGVAALMISAATTEMTPAEIKEAMKATARAFPAPVDKPIGAGIIDAAAAVQYAIDGPPPPCEVDCVPPATPIVNGSPVRALSGGVDSETLYSIEVPAGVSGPLSITTTGGSGDVSLHVSLGEAPADSGTWNSSRPGNAETIRINAPAAGTYYIKLKGVRAYSNVTLQARFSLPPV
ncbi:hypothetical protein AO715_16115 [Xanthomonas sp. Mitacek01]|nr:hypothetical protein AO715_16115 [Xanthomonas sp. Mitacek01]